MARRIGIGGGVVALGAIAGVQLLGVPSGILQAESSGQGAGPWSKDPPEWVIEKSVHYSGCREVRALGKDPLYRGDPGYREGMDGDSDGIACEPYRY